MRFPREAHLRELLFRVGVLAKGLDGVLEIAGGIALWAVSPGWIVHAVGFLTQDEVYVSDERGKAEAVIAVNKDMIVKTIFFDSETGMPQYDPIANRVLVNLQDENLLEEIDPATDTVVARYPVGKCVGNHGMALDVARRRAFLSCEGNDILTVFGPDVVKFDPGLGRIYVACYSGAISVLQEDDPDHFRKLEDFPVQRRVHSLAVDVKTHRVYTPEEQENGRPVARMIVYAAVVHP